MNLLRKKAPAPIMPQGDMCRCGHPLHAHYGNFGCWYNVTRKGCDCVRTDLIATDKAAKNG